MKKSSQITALTTLLTFLLIGTAIAHPLNEDTMQWDITANTLISASSYAGDCPSKATFTGLSQNQGSNLWAYASRFTRIQQVVEFAGYRANLTVTIQSMLQSVRDIDLAPMITLEFVW